MMAKKSRFRGSYAVFFSACFNFLGILYHPIHLKSREKLDLISSNVPVPERRPDEFFLDDDVMVKAEGLAT